MGSYVLEVLWHCSPHFSIIFFFHLLERTTCCTVLLLYLGKPRNSNTLIVSDSWNWKSVWASHLNGFLLCIVTLTYDMTTLYYSLPLLLPALKSSNRSSAIGMYQAKLLSYTISSTSNYTAGALESQTSYKITMLITDMFFFFSNLVATILLSLMCYFVLIDLTVSASLL